MAVTREESRRRDWSQTIGIGVLMLVGASTPSIYAWIAGKPVTLGTVVGPLCAWGFLLPILLLVVKFQPKPVPLPEPWQTKLRDTLIAEGLARVRIAFLEHGDPALYPRPMAIGYQLSLSRRVLEEFSPEALLWSVKTDAEAAVRFVRRGAPIALLPMLGSLLSTALGERWRAPNAFYAVPAVLFVLSFVLMCILGMRYQFAADRRFTRTEADRQAAKEALGYPYFAQCDRSPGKRWLFPRAELRKRAERLRIELERGYRVP